MPWGAPTMGIAGLVSERTGEIRLSLGCIMNTRNLVFGLVVLLVIGGYLAYNGTLSVGAKPTPTPLSELSDLDHLVTAAGTLLPVQRANLSFKVAGQVEQVLVKQGDRVKQGDPLARLEATEMQAAVAIAQASLNQLKAGATKEEIALAQANLDSARAQLAKIRAGPTAEDVAMARASLVRAQANLNDAQAAYDKVRDDPAVGMYPQSQALHLATQEYQMAQARYDQVLKGATAEDIRIAETAVAAAQASLDKVTAGARPEEIAAAQARLDQAKAVLAGSILRAPFDGTIASVGVREGETVSPGTPVLTLGDLSKLILETDDLSETGIARVKVGHSVNVTFEALPGQLFKGQVTDIAPIATAKQGGTNYTVTVKMDQLDPALRWGMTGHVEIDTNQ